MTLRVLGQAYGKRGIVLVFTLLVMLLLMVITLGFATFTTADAKATDANWEQTTCYYLAEAGIDYGLFLLKRNLAVYPAKSGQLSGVNEGALVNLITQGNHNGQDHVLLSELSYTSTNDWMGATAYSGGFHLWIPSASLTGSRWTVNLTSMGSIRSRESSDYTQFANWRARAQRTVNAVVWIDSTDTAQNRFSVERYYEKFR